MISNYQFAMSDELAICNEQLIIANRQFIANSSSPLDILIQIGDQS